MWLATPDNYGGQLCQHLAGPALDEFVSQRVLTALEPAALELSLEAAMHLEQERSELDRLWQHRLERAAFEAERALSALSASGARVPTGGTSISPRMGRKAHPRAATARELPTFPRPANPLAVSLLA